MEKLENAIEVIKSYNDLSFDEFLIIFEKAKGIKVSNEKRDAWFFIGLNNIDFYRLHKEFLKEE